MAEIAANDRGLHCGQRGGVVLCRPLAASHKQGGQRNVRIPNQAAPPRRLQPRARPRVRAPSAHPLALNPTPNAGAGTQDTSPTRCSSTAASSGCACGRWCRARGRCAPTCMPTASRCSARSSTDQRVRRTGRGGSAGWGWRTQAERLPHTRTHIPMDAWLKSSTVVAPLQHSAPEPSACIPDAPQTPASPPQGASRRATSPTTPRTRTGRSGTCRGSRRTWVSASGGACGASAWRRARWCLRRRCGECRRCRLRWTFPHSEGAARRAGVGRSAARLGTRRGGGDKGHVGG